MKSVRLRLRKDVTDPMGRPFTSEEKMNFSIELCYYTRFPGKNVSNSAHHHWGNNFANILIHSKE